MYRTVGRPQIGRTLSLGSGLATKRNFHTTTKLLAGNGKDAKSSSITYNSKARNSPAHSKINIFKWSDYNTHGGVHPGLQPLKKNQSAIPPKKHVTPEETLKLAKFVSETYGKVSKNTANSAMHLNGKLYSTLAIHHALNMNVMQPAVTECGLQLKKNGFIVDSMPQFWPEALYGDPMRMYVGNTHGLRESDIGKMKAKAAEIVAQRRQENPTGTFTFVVSYKDTRITSDHATLGGTVSTEDESAPLGQAHHAQTHFGMTTDGKFVADWTQESTGSANHPTGYGAKNHSFSWGASHKNGITNNLEPRFWSKDGKIDLESISIFMPDVQGQNSNMFYAVDGDQAQSPQGLHYKDEFTIHINLSDEAAVEVLAAVLLAEKGGQVIHADEQIPNPNKKYEKEAPFIEKVLSAGSFGQHAQSGGQAMCARTALFQAFGPNGAAFIDGGWPFLHSFQKPDTTYDTFGSMALYAMASETKNVTLHDRHGKAIPPERYGEVLGKGTIENYRKAILKSRENLPGSVPTEPGKEMDDIVMVNGSGVTIPVSMREPGYGSDNPTDNVLTPFISHRPGKLNSRYGLEQQSKDFGKSISSDTPMNDMERQGVVDLFKQVAEVYQLPDEALAAILEKLPPEARPAIAEGLRPPEM